MEQKWKLIACMLTKAVETSITNHMYRFDGVFYKQTDGGPIGDELSQAIARQVMIWWDREFLRICSEINLDILFYTRYVDDVNLAIIPPPPGTRFVEGELKLCPEFVESDKNEGVDMTSSKIMKCIADSVSSMLIFELDVCSNYRDKRLPILDLKVWPHIKEDMIEIRHCFYKKPMATIMTLRENTAFSS